MSELNSISTLENPNTITTLEKNFKELGITEGMTLIVHSSLSSLGWVCGGAVSVILALENTLTENGTLIMPTHSSVYSDPERWQNPPVPSHWWEIIKNEMPCFHKDITPAKEVGIIPEVFRKQNGVIRSNHPTVSFAGWGKNKSKIITDETFENCLGEKSPLSKIYKEDGYILLLGVDHDSNTSLHLSEYRSNFKGKKFIKNGYPTCTNNIRKWEYFDDIEIDSDDFINIGKDFEQDYKIKTIKIGKALAKLIRQRDIVDYGIKWLEENRN